MKPHEAGSPPFPWYSKTPEELFEDLHASPHGLSAAEAAARLAVTGPNALPEEKRQGAIDIFLGQFKSPLIYVLIVSDIIVFFLREFTDGFIILFVLLFNAVLGSIQEGRAERTLAALKQFTKTDAEVVRDGLEITIPDTDVVPGDILALTEGGKVPADARLISVRNLTIDEAALTGESEPVRKRTDPIAGASLPTADQRNMVFKGTTITTGYGKAITVATGEQTVIGTISKTIAGIQTEIPLQKNLRELARIVVIIVAALIVALFVLGIIDDQPFREMFVTAVAIAVAAVPEGLPLVLTVVLALGVSRMAKRHVLVKKLQAVEALGQAQEIAVDKTGTITKNELVVREVYINRTSFPIEGTGYAPLPLIPDPPPELQLAARIAHFSSSAHLAILPGGTSYRMIGDPTEGALTVFGEKAGVSRQTLLAQAPLINDWPFNYEKKYRAALYEADGKPFLSVTGAPEIILALCYTEYINGEAVTLTDGRRNELESLFFALSGRGLRVIGFAFAPDAPRETTAESLPPLVFGGFFAMQDALREGIRDQVLRAQTAGIRVIMITGDHAVTAQAIAAEAGIFRPGDGVLTGADLETLPEETLRERILKATVFARVTPTHKMRIIEDYRRRGQIIAMTGDGVNDAPSLVAADLGIAMGKIGTEVAKEASDIILLEDNFGDILSAIEEGRNMRQGLRRTITYLFSSNLGEIVAIAIALTVRDPLPLLAAQIIWMNLVTDTFFDISLALEPKDPSLMERGVRIPRKLFDGVVASRLAVIAPMIGLGAFLFFKESIADLTYARTMALMSLIVFQWFNAWNCRSETRSVFSMNPFSNKYLVAVMAWVILLSAFALYTPFMQKILTLTPLAPLDWLKILSVGICIVLAEEIRKLFSRRMSLKRLRA